jgi:hypothetical protein
MFLHSWNCIFFQVCFKNLTSFLYPKSKHTLLHRGSMRIQDFWDQRVWWLLQTHKTYLVATGEVADGSLLRIRCLAPSRSLWEWDALDICLSVSISHDRTLLLQTHNILSLAQQYELVTVLYTFFWVIPLHLKFKWQHFGTLCHLHRQVGMRDNWGSSSSPSFCGAGGNPPNA